MPIKSVKARQIFDSRGNPTVEVDVVTEKGLFRAAVPSGASTGIYEALELRDNVKAEYHGKGVKTAIKNINDQIAPALVSGNFDPTQQQAIDKAMLDLDGTDNKNKLGANAILGVSMAVCKAGAVHKGIPLYRYLAELAGNSDVLLPVPAFNVINGGSHAGNKLAMQEFMILPTGASSFTEAMRMGSEVYHHLKKVIKDRFGLDATAVGDEGGFAPNIQNNKDALSLIQEAIEKAGYTGKIEIGMDVAASEFFKEGKYDLDFKNPASDASLWLEPNKLADLYREFCKDFPIIRYIRRRKEFMVSTVVGNTLLTYGSSNLRLLSVSPPVEEPITCLATDDFFEFTASGKEIYAWKKGTDIQYRMKCESSVKLLMTFGKHLLSVEEMGTLLVWDVASEAVYLELEFTPTQFRISALVHPETYLNKVVLGSEQGPLQLWNLKTGKLVHSFEGWGVEITALEQTPAVDVLGVGLKNGDIMIHNFRCHRTLMKFHQDWGYVTSLSFRTDTEEAPVMASGSPMGHIALWNLEEKRLCGEIRDAHSAAVAGVKFLPGEALLVTNSDDNSLKMWTFDLPDGGARILRLREGFASPPTFARFYGSLGKTLLAASADSTIRSFSTATDMLNRSLGRASWHSKQAKKLGGKHDQHLRMSPVIEFAAETIREEDWDNLVAIHAAEKIATTWTIGRSRMGSHKMVHSRFQDDPKWRNAVATSVAMSPCGNFAFVGYSSGHVDKFNVQSGKHRGTAVTEGLEENRTAHEGSVTGVACDGLNQRVISTGEDQKVRFWRSRNLKHLGVFDADRGIVRMELCRENGLLALALKESNVILIVDVETRKLARSFREVSQIHSSSITDLAFSPDGRWLVTAGRDRKVSVWDVVSGHLLDSFFTPSPCTSLSFSPTSEFLATCHDNELGVFLWANSTLFSTKSLKPLGLNYVPSSIQLPGNAPLSLLDEAKVEDDDDESSIMDVLHDESSSMVFDSQPSESMDVPEDLVTMSLLPPARWSNLLKLDLIRQRNKPKEPPKVPKSGPFFLPTVPGLEFRFDLDAGGAEKPDQSSSKHLSANLFEPTDWAKILLDTELTMDYETVFERLKEMGPAQIDSEIRSLSTEETESYDLPLCFLKMIERILRTRRDYELSQAYLGLFLKVHWSMILSSPVLLEYLISEVEPALMNSWNRVVVSHDMEEAESIWNSLSDSYPCSPPLTPVAQLPVLPSREQCRYTSNYCEENVWHLCDHIHQNGTSSDLSSSFAVFISNAIKAVPLWMQKAAITREYVIWDYHVIFVHVVEHLWSPLASSSSSSCSSMANGLASIVPLPPKRKKRSVWVYDLDSLLPFPCPFQQYVCQTFNGEKVLKPEFRPLFRVVPATDLLQYFHSDRNHMRRQDGTWIKDPPPYPPIESKDPNAVTLETYIDMDPNMASSLLLAPVTSDGMGEVFRLQDLLEKFLGARNG
ncbi:unnamed protein product [Cyprideis torosa]|uniref:phosphopyruvate hydratase n=1 Tax=Cyprideis torosa TaxID=163714 RepID=A0A7R8W4B3_9CRUS|nr:unnamed protein product [Cyprideis torosa]CAG0883822.1 unnamed protein product [Cyprideis torosa]